MNDTHDVSVDDVRRVYRLVQSCLDNWSDTSAWQAILVRGIREIVNEHEGEGIGLLQLAVPASVAGNVPTIIPIAYDGWRDQEAEQTYLDSLRPDAQLELPNFADAAAPTFDGKTSAFSREMILEERAWRASPMRNEVVIKTGVDEFACALKMSPTLRSIVMLSSHRGLGREAVGEREVRMLGILAEEIVPLLGTRLAMTGQVNVSRLTRRQRETLDLLLEGLSEKQVAAELGIQPTTVHDYVVQLHKYFGVSSRGELMSYFVKRRPRSEPRTARPTG